MIKNFKLSKEHLEKFSQYESSITHWSLEHSQSVLKTKKLLETVESMYVGRQKFVDEIMAANGIPTKDVMSVNISPDGDTVVEVREPIPPVAVPPQSSEA